MARLSIWSLVAACVLLRLTPPWEIHHDCGWLLFVADRWLAGDALYSELIEVNPPLIVYLNAPPAAIAKWTGLGVGATFHLWVVALLGLSLWLTRRVLTVGRAVGIDVGIDVGKAAGKAAGSDAERSATLASPFGLAALAFVLLVPVGREFGQREHLMTILTLPYFAVVAARLRGAEVDKAWAFGAGLWAAIGFALKPHFLLAPLLVWVGTALCRRRWIDVRRAENLAVALGIFAYAVHFVFVPFRAEFFANVELVREVYSSYEISWSAFIRRPWMVEALVVSLSLLVAAIVARRERAWIRVLALAQLGFVGAAVWQGKGWNNHIFPVLACGYLGLVVLVCCSGAWWLRGAFVVGCLGYVALPMGQHWLQRQPELSLASEFTGITEELDAVRSLSPGSKVLVLDTDMHTFFAWMVDHKIGWASRYVFLWSLPGGSLERREELRQIVLADLAKHEPELVFVRRAPLSFMDADFDLLTWLRADWSDYEEQAGSAKFRVWRRR